MKHSSVKEKLAALNLNIVEQNVTRFDIIDEYRVKVYTVWHDPIHEKWFSDNCDEMWATKEEAIYYSYLNLIQIAIS